MVARSLKKIKDGVGRTGNFWIKFIDWLFNFYQSEEFYLSEQRMKLLDLIRVSVPKVGQQIEALHGSLANIELVSCNMQLSTCSSNSSNG